MSWLKNKVRRWLTGGEDRRNHSYPIEGEPSISGMLGGLEHKKAVDRITNVTITKADNGFVVLAGEAVFITEDIRTAVDQIIAGVVAKQLRM